MQPQDIITLFEKHAENLAHAIHTHPKLSALIKTPPNSDPKELARTYARWLKITTGYVRFTVPMLKAAGEALKDGDTQDKEWSARFMSYKREETDEQHGYGHEQWSKDDIITIGNPEKLAEAKDPDCTNAYGSYFVEHAKEHPYAILGAKGVLEHLSIKMAKPMAEGLRASNIPNIQKALTFIDSHGELDINHVREGNQAVLKITDKKKLEQIQAGANFTLASYQTFLDYLAN